MVSMTELDTRTMYATQYMPEWIRILRNVKEDIGVKDRKEIADILEQCIIWIAKDQAREALNYIRTKKQPPTDENYFIGVYSLYKNMDQTIRPHTKKEE